MPKLLNHFINSAFVNIIDDFKINKDLNLNLNTYYVK